MAFVKRIIAEYELHDVDKRPPGRPDGIPWRSLWQMMWRSRMWVIPLIFAGIYAMDLNSWRDSQECYGSFLIDCFAEDAQQALSDTADAVVGLLNAAEALRESAQNLLQAFCIVLLLRVFACVTGIINALRAAPYAMAQGLGLESVDVMRLTRRCCLLVGRRSGVCMRFPWADYKNARVMKHSLLLRAHKVGHGLVLPLPQLDAEEQNRLQRELDAVFAASPAAQPTTPPENALCWKGSKPADILLDGVHENPRLRSLRKIWLLVWFGLSACFIGGMLCAGFVPKLTIILALLYAYLMTRGASLLPQPAEWRYILGRTRYVLYTPYGGVCRVPRSLLQEALMFSRTYLLRLRGDAYALLPCHKADAAGLPLISNRLKGIRYFLIILAWELFVIAMYWDAIKGLLH